MNLNFVKYNKVFFLLSIILVLFSLFIIFYLKPQFGIDFKGGSQFEIVVLTPEVSKEEITQILMAPEFDLFQLGTILVREIDNQKFLIRTRKISPTIHAQVIQEMRNQEIFIEDRGLTTISPIIGREMKQNSIIVIIVALLAMGTYIALAFYKLRKPIKNWKYAIITLFTLLHDITLTLAIVVILNYFYGLEITIPIIVAFLTILGYSINDTVVVFDRIRENLLKGEASIESKKQLKEGLKDKDRFNILVNKSLNQVFNRSLATSITTLLVLFVLFFLGGEIVKNFALVLIIGIILGTYSSFFIASQWLIILARKKEMN